MTAGQPKRVGPNDPAFMKHADHGLLWRMVEGAVVDALWSHPDYLTGKGHNSAVRSITKRVVGQLVGHAKGALRRGHESGCRREKGRLTPSRQIGSSPEDDPNGGGVLPPASGSGFCDGPPDDPAGLHNPPGAPPGPEDG